MKNSQKLRVIINGDVIGTFRFDQIESRSVLSVVAKLEALRQAEKLKPVGICCKVREGLDIQVSMV